jgi:DNA-3-methyladenine glycosylase II
VGHVTSPSSLTAADFARAEKVLARRDPILGAIIRAVGCCRLGDVQRLDPFTFLTRALVFQQLSGKAAGTIFGRFLALLPNGGPPRPETVLVLSDDQLRSAGVSRQKIGYLRDLCERVAAGEVPLDHLDVMSDEETVTALTHVKGIGRWSAEMFLMFRLQRPDVLPVGDLGIANAIQRAYRLRTRPSPEKMQALAEAWRPYRTVACWYLWRSLEMPATPALPTSPARARKKPSGSSH